MSVCSNLCIACVGLVLCVVEAHECVHHEHTGACRDQRRMLGVLLCSPLYFLKPGPLNERGDRLAACKPQ